MPASRRAPHIAFPGEPLYCPNGHRLPHDVWSIGSDVVVFGARRCTHKSPPNNRLCGLIVCFARFADDTRLVIEVTSAEAHHMERLTKEEAALFLNLRWAYTGDPAHPLRPGQLAPAAAPTFTEQRKLG